MPTRFNAVALVGEAHSTMSRRTPNDFEGRLRARLDALEVPDCDCPVYARCPECGAPPDEDCKYSCRICEREWPEGADRCPGCGFPAAPDVMAPGRKDQPDRRVLRQHRVRIPCPRKRQPRPALPPCRHVLASDHDTPYGEWHELMLAHDPSAYQDRPEPLSPAIVLPGPAKAEVMRGRESDDEALWHPLDCTFELAHREGRPGQHFKNGAKTSPVLRIASQVHGAGKGVA